MAESDEVHRAGMQLHFIKQELDLDNERLEPIDQSRLMLERFGFDADEVVGDHDVAMRLLTSFVNGSKNGVPIGNLVHGIWIDGIMTGVQIERNRRESDGD